MATAFNEMTSHLRHWHEQAEERAKRLETSYERFHSVTESARDGIVSTNAQGSITFWNRSAATIFGYDEADALGTSFAHLLAESDRPLFLEALAVGFGPPGSTFGQTVELTGRRKNVATATDRDCPFHRTDRRHLLDGGCSATPPQRRRSEDAAPRARNRAAAGTEDRSNRSARGGVATLQTNC